MEVPVQLVRHSMGVCCVRVCDEYFSWYFGTTQQTATMQQNVLGMGTTVVKGYEYTVDPPFIRRAFRV